MDDSRILVVDDEERTRTFICDGLNTLGITARAIGVSSAEETNIERSYYLALIYDQRWQASRIGAVWLSARRVARELARRLAPAQLPVPIRPNTTAPSIEP